MTLSEGSALAEQPEHDEEDEDGAYAAAAKLVGSATGDKRTEKAHSRREFERWDG
jgi:hypothetical protein